MAGLLLLPDGLDASIATPIIATLQLRITVGIILAFLFTLVTLPIVGRASARLVDCREEVREVR